MSGVFSHQIYNMQLRGAKKQNDWKTREDEHYEVRGMIDEASSNSSKKKPLLVRVKISNGSATRDFGVYSTLCCTPGDYDRSAVMFRASLSALS